ncbi:MAG: hypothetical protein ACOWWR_00775 [Eubacteriales bacterium]
MAFNVRVTSVYHYIRYIILTKNKKMKSTSVLAILMVVGAIGGLFGIS